MAYASMVREQFSASFYAHGGYPNVTGYITQPIIIGEQIATGVPLLSERFWF